MAQSKELVLARTRGITDDGYLLEIHPKELIESSGVSASDQRGRRCQLAQELGLTELARDHALNPETATQWCRAQGLKPLSEAEYDLWRAYLPTPYWSDTSRRINATAEDRTDSSGHQSGRSFSSYSFHEGVPLHVMERMRAVKSLFVHEIRTPELNVGPDPAWFGHVVWPGGKHHVYLLARWGRDSDSNFLPDIESVRSIVRSRRSGVRLQESMAWLTLALASVLGFSVGAYLNQEIFYSGAGVIAGLFLGFCVHETIGHRIGKRYGCRKLAAIDPKLVPLF